MAVALAAGVVKTRTARAPTTAHRQFMTRPALLGPWAPPVRKRARSGCAFVNWLIFALRIALIKAMASSPISAARPPGPGRARGGSDGGMSTATALRARNGGNRRCYGPGQRLRAHQVLPGPS